MARYKPPHKPKAPLPIPTFTCCICGNTSYGWGNNPDPVAVGKCCDYCNVTKVIPARLKMDK